MAQGTVLLWLLGIPFLFIIFGAMVFDNPFMRDLSNSSLFVYISGAILCSHPFIALGITQGLLLEGENPFFFTMDLGGGQQLLAPSPWLAFTFIALLLAAMCMVVSMRMLAPMRGPMRGQERRQRKQRA
jgi:hypothetical protein